MEPVWTYGTVALALNSVTNSWHCTASTCAVFAAHSIFIRTVWLSTLLKGYKLISGRFGQRKMHCTLRVAKILLSIYCTTATAESNTAQCCWRALKILIWWNHVICYPSHQLWSKANYWSSTIHFQFSLLDDQFWMPQAFEDNVRHVANYCTLIY